MNENKPTISVLMGVYYQRKDIFLLERSVSSILNQTISSLELLICDDGSTEFAKEYLDEISSKDIRVKLIRRGDLFSLPEKLNACLKEAKGEWIARMDDDDFSHPERFEKQLEYFTNHPEVDFVGSNVNLYKDDAIVGTRSLPEKPTVHDFYFVQPYIHPALIFRRRSLVAVNGYSEKKHSILCEDYDLLLRMYSAGFVGANIQECLLDYTLPQTAKGNRKMKHRWNEVVTRFIRFKELGCLPGAFPYVVKPIVVGLIPNRILEHLKKDKGLYGKKHE